MISLAGEEMSGTVRKVSFSSGPHASRSMITQQRNFHHDELIEIDYPTIYARPQHKVVDVLRQHKDSLHMYQFRLPERL